MSTAVTSVPTGTWNVDAVHSVVEFSVKHMGISTVKGSFTDFAGSLTIGEDGKASASGTVEVASVTTREGQRDEHLKSPDFFDAASFPQITFQSTEITSVDDESFKIVGDLTIRGTTKSVTLDATLEGADTDPQGNERVGLSLTGQINRQEFGMKFSAALGSGNLVVSDKVKLSLDISAVKAA
ncbi:MAG TPA: YceI family protein [Conexibacter sp.]|jgi:polyisoprenoid-binding protein YceI